MPGARQSREAGPRRSAGSSLLSRTISSVHNGFELWTLEFFLLYFFSCVSYLGGVLSADMCSLLYSILGLSLSMLGYIGGSYMEASVVVVVGCKMVGTSSMRDKSQIGQYTGKE